MLQGFVSFCGRQPRSKGWARQLVARLAAQPVEIWVYERPGHFVPHDGDVMGRIRGRIRASDLFVALVTEDAFGSAYVQAEVTEALEAHASGQGLTLMTLCPEALAEQPWPEPFEQLRSAPPTTFAPDTPEPFEALVECACARLDMPYFSPEPVDPRLPVRRRLAMEIGEQVPKARRHDMGAFLDLMEKALLVEQLHCQDDTRTCRQKLGELLQHLEEQFEGRTTRYVRVALGVIQLQERRLDEARLTFEGLLADTAVVPNESVHGGLAAVRHADGDLHGALEAYAQAQACCPGRDPALAFNQLLCHIQAGLALDRPTIDDLVGDENEPLLVNAPGERAKLDLLRVVALLHAGERDAAVEALARQRLDEAAPIELVLALVGQIEELDTPDGLRLARAAIELLQAAVTPGSPWTGRHALARLCFRVGDLRPAEAQFARLCAEQLDELQLTVEWARALRALGRRFKARRVLRDALRRASEPASPLQWPDHQYYLGFALWMLKRSREALAAFAASGRDPTDLYAEILAQDDERSQRRRRKR